MNIIPYLILALISPFLFGLVAIVDKFVISHRVKNLLGFLPVAGLVNLAIGFTLTLFSEWEGITLSELIFPILAGLFFGAQYYVYFYLLKKEDISDVIGFIFMYPILVTILSFLFLKEVLPLISYLGLALILIGVVALSIKDKKLKFKVSLWALVLEIVLVALYEFFTKVSTIDLPILTGLSVEYFSIGCAILSGLAIKKIRGGFVKELKHLKWAVLSETLTFFAVAAFYLAMVGLPAAIVSSIAAVQSLAVLLLEFCAHKLGLNITVDADFRKRIIPILLIILGIITVYIKEILNIFI